MNPERWQKIDDLFHAALQYESDEREFFITESCQGDDELRRELRSMLDHHDQTLSFLESPAYQVVAEAILGDDSQTLPGTSFGSYRILSKLGAGGMGEVYLALDTKLQRKVALKFLPAYLTSDQRRVHRFRHEARAASALNHPNILTIYEVGDVEGRQFIATEFIEGETLREHMKRGRMTLQETLHIALQTGSALSAAHGAGIVHRDFKPENVMVRPDGYLKLLDFGLAKLTERPAADGNDLTLPHTEKGERLGTVSYMPPEQVRGLQIDTRSDIWSFGVVLYEMIAGCLPFEGKNTGDLIVNILGSEPVPLSSYAPDTPVELNRLIQNALCKDRTERLQTMKEFLVELDELKSRLNAGESVRTIGERRKILVALSVLAVAVFGALVVVLIPSWRSGLINPPANMALPAPVLNAERVLKYSLTVQKIRNDRPYDEPFQSNGREIFENGWKFRMNFSSPESGFLYLLNEGKALNVNSGLTILFPDTSKGSNPIQIPNDQTTQTDWYVFDKNAGTEKLWIVWSTNSVPELESVRRFLNPEDKGFISIPTDSKAVQDFLVAHATATQQLETETDKGRTIAKAKGDVLVSNLRLEHR